MLGMAYAANADSGSATTWALALSISSLAVALASVSISFWQARNNIAEIRRARPNVAGRVFYASNMATGRGDDIRAIMVSLSNTGKEPTTISTILVYEKTGKTMVMINGGNNLLDSPTLPYRLETHAGETFIIKAESLSDKRALVFISLGHKVNLEAVASLDNEGTDLVESQRTFISSDTEY
jgi:hypothetical protein